MQRSAYDEVSYATYPREQTHPDRLAALAALLGMNPAPVERCRVLELGCGDGGNLIPMAMGLPESTLVGIDSAETPISRGRELVQRLGLKNVRLEAMDIMDFGADRGQFDYIIAHGLFSWVPPRVQEQILAICRTHLAPQGVAFISYNALPGWHLRTIARDIMRFHTEHFEDPAQKVAQARAILNFVARAVPEKNETWRRILADEEAHVAVYPGVFHDHLEPENHPFYFHQFMARAEAAGLQYLADAEFSTMHDRYLEPDVRATLNRLGGHDILIKEQFLDFINGQGFRRSLLCHAEVDLSRAFAPERMRMFSFSCNARVIDEDGQPLGFPARPVLSDQAVIFQAASGSLLQPAHPVPREALLGLIAAFPARESFDALAERTAADEEGQNALAEILLGAVSADIAGLHRHRPAFAAVAGERPLASPLARIQALEGLKVVNLAHQMVDLENTGLQYLLPLLDGTRDRQTLAEAIHTAAESETIPDRPAMDLEAALRTLARHALLMA